MAARHSSSGPKTALIENNKTTVCAYRISSTYYFLVHFTVIVQ